MNSFNSFNWKAISRQFQSSEKNGKGRNLVVDNFLCFFMFSEHEIMLIGREVQF